MGCRTKSEAEAKACSRGTPGWLQPLIEGVGRQKMLLALQLEEEAFFATAKGAAYRPRGVRADVPGGTAVEEGGQGVSGDQSPGALLPKARGWAAAVVAALVLTGLSAGESRADEAYAHGTYATGGYLEGDMGLLQIQDPGSPGLDMNSAWMLGTANEGQPSLDVTIPPVSSYFDSQRVTRDSVPLSYRFPGADLTASGMYFDDDDWAVGLNVDLQGGMSLVANFSQDRPEGYSGSGSYDLGMSYDLGDWKVGFAYFNSVLESSPSLVAEQFEAIEAGVTFDLSPQLSASVNAIYAQHEAFETDTRAEGMAGVVGFSFQF